MRTQPETSRPEATAGGGRALWWFVGGAFLALVAAWGVFFAVASRHPVQTVPLEHREGR